MSKKKITQIEFYISWHYNCLRYPVQKATCYGKLPQYFVNWMHVQCILTCLHYLMSTKTPNMFTNGLIWFNGQCGLQVGRVSFLSLLRLSQAWRPHECKYRCQLEWVMLVVVTCFVVVANEAKFKINSFIAKGYLFTLKLIQTWNRNK